MSYITHEPYIIRKFLSSVQQSLPFHTHPLTTLLVQRQDSNETYGITVPPSLWHSIPGSEIVILHHLFIVI